MIRKEVAMLVSKVTVCGKKALFTTDIEVNIKDDKNLKCLSLLGKGEYDTEPSALVDYSPTVKSIGVIIFKDDIKTMDLDGFDEEKGIHFINPEVLKPLAEMLEFLD